MTTSDRIMALVIALVSVLIVVGFKAVLPAHAASGASAVSTTRGEPYP